MYDQLFGYQSYLTVCVSSLIWQVAYIKLIQLKQAEYDFLKSQVNLEGP